jgi:hypothetical protein
LENQSVNSFFCFFSLFSFSCHCSNWKTCYGLRGYCYNYPIFLINSRVDMASFLDLHKAIARNAFFNLFMCMKWNWTKRWIRKWSIEMSIFTTERGFEFTRDALNQFSLKKNNTKEKSSCDILCLHSSIVFSKS